MRQRAQEERRKRGAGFGESEGGACCCVDVSEEEGVYGLVPFAGVFVPCC